MALLPFGSPPLPAIVPISRGGTGSATQNFVDLSTAQMVGGNKTFSSKITASADLQLGVGYLYDANGNKALQIPATTSAVNYLTLANKATGGIPILGVAGSDANISLAIAPKGTGYLQLQGTALQFASNQSNPQIYQASAFNTGAGYPLSLIAQAAQPSTMDTNGGSLILSGGGVTGAGTSQIQFKTAGGNASGTTGYNPSVIWTMDGSGNLYPAVNGSQNVGSPSFYTKYIYGSRLYLNSTAYLDGGTAGEIDVTGNFYVGSSKQIELTSGGSIIFSNGMSLGSTGMNYANGQNLIFGTTTGTQIGTAATQKLAHYGAAPVVQPATTGTTTGFTAGAGTTVDSAATFTGNTGTKAYTIGDIVNALKLLGLLAA